MSIFELINVCGDIIKTHSNIIIQYNFQRKIITILSFEIKFKKIIIIIIIGRVKKLLLSHRWKFLETVYTLECLLTAIEDTIFFQHGVLLLFHILIIYIVIIV